MGKQYNDSIDALSYAVEKMVEKKIKENHFFNSDTWKEIRERHLKSKPLLVIELQDENSVPKVSYKGEEITHKQNVFLEWNTDTAIMGGLTYSIEHADLGEGYPVTNRIERKVKGHACT